MTPPRTTPRKDRSSAKVLFLAFVCSVCGMGLWARAYYVQIVWGNTLGKQAERQYWATTYSQGDRGEIFDRKGRLLAKSVRSYSLYLRPVELVDAPATVRALHKILGGSSKVIARHAAQKKNFVWVARQLSDQQVAAIRKLDLPGVYLKEGRMRIYPQGHLAGQLVGFVGVDGTGLEGLEKSLNTVLSGSGARRTVQRDAAGQRLYKAEDPSLDGKNSYLTLDCVVQSAAENALAEAVEKFNGKTGLCLVVEVESGDILAWAHYPFFDPNQYTRSRPAVWKNRLSLDLVEPGSIFKPFVLAAALQKKICTPDSIYFCENGKWRVGGHQIRDTHSYQWLSVDRIIRYSSNIGMSKVGLSLGASALYAQLKRFGFLAPTGLPLPGESKGLIRPPRSWTSVDLAAASFGQGVAITPVQMAQAYVALGNGGKMKPLHLLRDHEKDPAEYRVVDQKVAHEILVMLKGVVEKEGTGTRARIPGISVGGKTGTAQKPDARGGYGKAFVASFVGFIPALNPRYFILAMVDEPHPQHYGGVVAAPVVRKVATKLLAYRGESPEQNESRGAASVSGAVKQSAVTGRVRQLSQKTTSHNVPDLCGLSLRRAVEILSRQGIVPQIRGEGLFVSRQRPRAGRTWPGKGAATCQLWLTATRSDALCQ